MGKDSFRIRVAVAVIGLLALFLAGAGDRAYAVSSVQTTTLTSGQVPTATQWNTYLNRAESWINSNLLNGGTTFTFAEGESLSVLGTLKVDSLRVTGFIDLAAHIIPRISRTYRIGSPTFLLSALHVDTARIVNGVIDSLSGAVVTTSTFSATPATNSTGRLGSNGKRFASVNVDTVRHTVAFDSNDVLDGGVSYADHAALSIDSLKVRASSISGSNLAPVLGGTHSWTGKNSWTAMPNLPDSGVTFTSDPNTHLVWFGADSAGFKTGGTVRQTWGSTGNVYIQGPLGIGTTSPTEKLHLIGSSYQVRVGSSATEYAGVYGGDAGSNSPAIIYQGDAFRFYDNDGAPGETLRIEDGGSLLPGTNKSQNLGSLAAAWDSVIADDLVNVADMPFFDDRDDILAIKKIRKSGEVDSLSGYKIVADSTLPKEIMVLYRKAGTHKEIRGTDTIMVAHAKGDFVKDLRGKGFYAVRNAFGLLFGAVKQLDKERSDLSMWVLGLQDSLRIERARIDAMLIRLNALDGK